MLSKLLENMKKADPERLARLEEMGYDTSKVWFHGTKSKPFNEFDAKKSNAMAYGPGIYFSDNPLTTDTYSKPYLENNTFGRTIPVFLKKGEYIDMRHGTDNKPFLGKSFRNILDVSPNKNTYLSDLSPDMTIKGGERYFDEMIRKNTPDDIAMELYLNGYGKDTKQFGKDLSKEGIQGFKVDWKKDPHNPFPASDSITESYKIIPDVDNIKSIWAKGLSKKGLMTGAVAMDPLHQIGQLVDIYRTNQEKVADAITKQVTQPFGEADELQKTMMRFALDPLNVVEGPAALGLTAVEMMGKKND